MLTNLGIHLMPMVIMYNIRWYTIPDQADLPVDQKRFVDLAADPTWSSYFYTMIMMPVLFYLMWSVTYSFINFKLAKDRIKKKGYDNMYQLFCNMGVVKKILGNNISPLGFMITHFTIFFLTHMVAILQYHSFWVSTVFVGYYCIISVWNGAHYYMEYFCKKYEK
jgi:hypothetical protein